MAPITFRIRTTGSGRRRDASLRSVPRPVVVDVAKYAMAAMAAMATRAMNRRTRSIGRRSRLPMTPSSITTVGGGGAPSPTWASAALGSSNHTCAPTRLSASSGKYSSDRLEGGLSC